MDPLYKPEGVEERWQRTWEEEGHYNADPDPTRESFAIAHPPPNVTGDLHLGHALQLSLADTIVRTRRMQGYNVLFQPGFDHAGIATQNAVEKHLATEGKSRQDLGREAFEARIWEWLREYGGKIMFQFRRIGASLDYRRERFTMDEAYVRAVMRFFVHLYGKGWIYRANRIINWCPFHETSLSDLEVAHEEVDDALTYVRYPFADGDGHITIATVRPATILADVAVAVHPEDDRYRDVIGREVIVPYVERRVPVIGDERVEREFGTGALKVTPGHDPLDYEIGRDHGLPELTVIGADGRMNQQAGDLTGLSQDEADERVLAWLKEQGQLEKREAYRHSIALCDRCKTRIEPRISLQWWCSMDELKQVALEALGSGRVRFHPESQHRFAVTSLEDAPDWNISRQIWWGHQLPVWECPDGHITVEETEPDACAECGSRELTRSTDVLDTWFSSALWPFATLGWPEDTEDLRYFYPGDLNTTARDIIRLWENRMIFSGLELMGDVPFRDVVIHSLIHAPVGGRMSKSLGTGMNPLASIETYGADATRYGLMKMASSQDVRFSEGAIEEGRKLANKLWNVARLILQASEGAAPAELPRTLEERWILARLSQVQREIERLLAEFDFSHVVSELYRVTFDDFCDWYAEAIKQRLYDGDADARATAVAALERLLKLLHPAMPHVTEEIWTSLPARETRLIVAPWPEAGDESAADALAHLQELAAVVRRSGVLPTKLEGEEQRIFDAVVRQRANGNVEEERARLRKEIERAEKMLANDNFVANAPPKVVEAEREKLARYRRELDAISDDELEAVAYDFWRAPEVAELDGWRLRFAHGVTGRANSVWPNGAGSLPLDEKIERAEAWYSARGVPTLFQLTEAARPAGLEEALVARGYQQGSTVSVQAASLADVLERTSGEAEVTHEVDDEWIALWAGTRGFDRLDVARAILVAGDAVFARVGDVAVGRGVAVGEWLGITSMATIPEARRRGHARAIVHSLARWAQSRGCRHAIVQVDRASGPALALYATIGFSPHHDYRYRILR